MTRKPAVAGAFYPGTRTELEKTIDFLLSSVDKSRLEKLDFSKALAFVAPHAGYVYSGYVAAYTYYALSETAKKRKIDTVAIIGPNHMGLGDFANVSLEDWETPLGIAKNDVELANELCKEEPRFSTDSSEIKEEHSVEVQVPFVQRLLGQYRFLFICMSDQSEEASKAVAEALLKASEELGREVIVVASSDFDHYEPASVAESKDMPAIKALEKLDIHSFNRLLAEADDTACGYGAISAAAFFAKAKGASKGVLLKYGNSGNMTNDYSSVVAYASIAFMK